MHIDVPQLQLVQLADDLLQDIGVLVGCTIQSTCTGLWQWDLGVGEVQQTHITGGDVDLIYMGSCQRRVPAGRLV